MHEAHIERMTKSRDEIFLPACLCFVHAQLCLDWHALDVLPVKLSKKDLCHTSEQGFRSPIQSIRRGGAETVRGN